MKAVLATALLFLSGCREEGYIVSYQQVSVTMYTCERIYPGLRPSTTLKLCTNIEDCNQFCNALREPKDKVITPNDRLP